MAAVNYQGQLRRAGRPAADGALHGRNAAALARCQQAMDQRRESEGRWYGALLEELPGRFVGFLLLGAIGVLILLFRTACG